MGCEAGVLDTLFGFNVLEKTDLITKFNKNNVPSRVLSVLEAVRELSVGTGQGVLKCNCKTGDCTTGRCSCSKADPPQTCNSRCHGGNVN